MREESPANSSHPLDSAAAESADFVAPVLQALGTLFGVGALVLEYGLIRISPATGQVLNAPPLSADLLHLVRYAAITLFVLAFWWRVTAGSERGRFLSSHLPDSLLSMAATAGLILFLAGGPLLAESQVRQINQGLTAYLVIQLALALGAFFIRLLGVRRDPVRAVFLTFPTMIILGAFVLSLPAAVTSPLYPDFGNNFLSQLFTAASAVCLAGLTVHNVATYYTPFGQLVILLLIQFGGFAILLLGALFWTSYTGRDGAPPFGPGIAKLATSIFVFMLFVEILAAILLHSLWQSQPLPEAAFRSVFHAVSALCNAGFTLQTDGWIGLADAWQTYAVIIPLVILGGLGYPVWHDLITRRLSLQTKIALLATAVLIVIGTLAIGRIEKPRNAQRWGRDVQYEDLAIKTDPGQMRNRDPYRRALDSLFLAVNARSGGFATVDTANGKLSPGTRSVLIALMTIGGAPASVAGGIKTVTFVVLLSAAAAAIRRRRTPAGTRPQAGASDGPRNRVVYHAAIVFFVYLAVLWFITTALAVTHPQIGFLDLAFEAASACGCVGLSTGVTPHLNLAGRLLLIVAFIFGRLAPLALLFSMAAPRRPSRLEQTDEPLMTG